MPDILIDGAAAGAVQMNVLFSQGADIHFGTTKYAFYLSDANTLVYRKSLDDGLTYAAEVTVFQNVLEDVAKVAFWFDQWTPADTGRIIHWALLARDQGGGATSSRQYRNLDTATDTLSAAVSIGQGGVNIAYNWAIQALSITKARSGRICIQAHHAAGGTDNWFVVSDDGGLTFTPGTGVGSLASATDDAASIDKYILLPGNETDPDDVYNVYLDRTAAELSLKHYDTLGDVWTETVFPAGGGAGTMNSSDDEYLQYAASVRASDNHCFVMVRNDVAVALQDINCFEITNATTITARTPPTTGTSSILTVGLNIDRVTGDLRYVQNRSSVFEVTTAVQTFLSTDGGVSWGAAVQYNEDADDDYRYLAVSLTQGLAGGRYMPIWHNNALSDVLTNFNNSVDEPGPPLPPVPPPPIVPAGGTYGPAAGAVPGSISYVTPPPESRVYPLVTPHHTGRFVMSFSGMGTPDIQYITQRGPNQDGETLRDFHLTPRVVQLLDRQQFVDRDAWWAGRATILDELRPNRQATATGVATGILRMVKSDGSIRDLNVLIESGPRFEARNVNEWDEWSFEEVLRFIAFDPLFFDPARVDFALPFVLDLNLVFPITFPITFGSGLIDVSLNLDYTGTWASLPTIVIVGPLENPIIENVTTGETLDLRHDVGPGETVTIDLAFGQKTITNNLGANLLGSLSTDSDLGTWHIAPTPEAPQVVGQPRPTARNVIRLRGSNPTGSTSVQVRYHTRYFGI